MVNWSLIRTPENLNNFHLCRMHCIVGWLKKIANFTQGDEDGVGQKRLVVGSRFNGTINNTLKSLSVTPHQGN